MKRILLFVFLLTEFFASGQTKPSYFTPVATPYEWTWGRFKYGLRPPTDTLPTADSGSIAYKNGVWYGKINYWSALGGGGGGSDSSLFATRYWANSNFQPAGDYVTNSFLSANHYTKTQINSFFGGTASIAGYNKANWDNVYASWAAAQALSPAGWATLRALTDTAAALRAIAGGGGGSGDMTKAVYDPGNNGTVDDAENLNGQDGTYYQTQNTGLRGVSLPSLTVSGGYLKYTGTGTNTWIFDANTYVTTRDRFGLSGEDATAGVSRSINFADTYNMTFAGVSNFIISRASINRLLLNNLSSGFYSPDGSVSVQASDVVAQLSAGGGANYIKTNSDSTRSPKRISYESNLHGSFTTYSLIDKSYLDSVAVGLGVPSLTQYRLAIGNSSNQLSTAAAITGNRAVVSDANGVPTHSATTAAQINYLSNLTSDVQTQINSKETGFVETTQEFTGATSMSVTLSNTPKTGKAEMYYLNGIVIKQSNISRTGTSVTLSGFTRESSDVITAKYSY
jgi:hypothetical protein